MNVNQTMSELRQLRERIGNEMFPLAQWADTDIRDALIAQYVQAAATLEIARNTGRSDEV